MGKCVGASCELQGLLELELSGEQGRQAKIGSLATPGRR